MIITRATEYSILAVLHMAERYPDNVVSRKEICDAASISPAYLIKILQPLIYLSRDPEEFTLIDVLRAADEPLTLNVCLIEGHNCERGDTCPVHELWIEAKESFETIFSRRSIADLARERKERGGQ
jgi:DNA-binding IscR family transcriptional regulator